MSSLGHTRAVELYQRDEQISILKRNRGNTAQRMDREQLSPRVNSSRIWRDILATAQYGGIAGTTGIDRLSLSDPDKDVRDWFLREAEAIGCNVNIDEMGNMFAVLQGVNNHLPPIGIGSHLDTQPSGGRFDGILGVIGALEVLRTIKEKRLTTYAPIAAINWTNEEGARFESGCSGSAVWASHLPLSTGHDLPSRCGSTKMSTELSRLGYLGSTSTCHAENSLIAHFELHIEQASRLERAHQKLGIIHGIPGIRWYRVLVRGEQAHAGSTPMAHRGDAFVATSKIVIHVEDLATRFGGFGTVGVIETEHSSSNCVPGQALFTIDLRHPSANIIALMEKSIVAEMGRLEGDNARIKFDLQRIWDSPAVRFDEQLLDCARKAAHAELGAEAVGEMDSFAGHDSAMTALRVPTAMIFVPSRRGISHAPEEFTSQVQCGDGVQVLLDTVLLYDERLQSATMCKNSAVNMGTTTEKAETFPC